MEKKSNIKDVCALLDMKSSKYLVVIVKPALIDIDDVNKALTEMHCDVGAKLGKDEF
jgi:hypothetical protein